MVVQCFNSILLHGNFLVDDYPDKWSLQLDALSVIFEIRGLTYLVKIIIIIDMHVYDNSPRYTSPVQLCKLCMAISHNFSSNIYNFTDIGSKAVSYN